MTDPVVAAPAATAVVGDNTVAASAVLYPDATVANPANPDPAASAVVTDPPKADDPAKADGATKEEDVKKDDDKPKEGAPEKYEDFTLPEGFNVDHAAMEKFTPLAKELNLSQEQAQKLVDLQAQVMKDQATSNLKAWEDVTEGWRNSVKADKEIGGQNYDTSLASAKLALKTFGTPELMQALVETGTGDHPEFIRVLSRIGKAMSEDSFKVGGNPANGPKDPAKTLFPNQN